MKQERNESRRQFIQKSAVLGTGILLAGLGPALESTPGHFDFTDADAPDYPTRFYQLTSP